MFSRTHFTSKLFESCDPSPLFSVVNRFICLSLGSPFTLNTSWLQRLLLKFPFHSSQSEERLPFVFMTGCPGFKESNRLPHSPSPMPLSEQQEKRRRRALHHLPPPHTLLHQALLGLVGLRMEHDDRQKQSSAPPCSAVFYTARAWKGCYEAYNRRSDRSTPWVNKISVGEQLHGSLYCSCTTMSALKLCEGKKMWNMMWHLFNFAAVMRHIWLTLSITLLFDISFPGSCALHEASVVNWFFNVFSMLASIIF